MQDQTDCMLPPAVFRQLWGLYVPFEVDGFASGLTVQCNPETGAPLPYWSMCVDAAGAVDVMAAGVDALTADWRVGDAWYAFPPVNEVQRLLLLLREQGARAVVVVPKWPAHEWWPLLQEGLAGSDLVELRSLLAPGEQLMVAGREGGPSDPLGSHFAHPDQVVWVAGRVDFALFNRLWALGSTTAITENTPYAS
jgi:hypothetical protein